MKTYKVTITETLRRTIEVEATTSKEALAKAEEDYYAEKHVLTSEDFEEVRFKIN